MATDTATARVMRAIGEATAARDEGRPADGLPRLRAVEALVDDTQLETDVAVAMLRERGLCLLALQETDAARVALGEAMVLTGGHGPLSDPLRAILATLELMSGAVQISQALLSDRGEDRQATLVAQARLHLHENETELALEALRFAELAPGGISDLHPPTAALRSLCAIWQGRLDQARMLYEGVGTDRSPWWELVRLLLLRARWVQTGDGRYLTLAVGTAEQLRFSATATIPGLLAAAAGQHAFLLAMTGQVASALDAADEAMEELGDLCIPEWPTQAVLSDLATVYGEGGAEGRLSRVHDRLPPTSCPRWTERLRQVTGPRGVSLCHGSREPRGDSDALVRMVTEQLAFGHGEPLEAFLRAVSAHLGATSVRWLDASGTLVGHTGIPSEDGDEGMVVVDLGAQGAFHIRDPLNGPGTHLDPTVIGPLAAMARSMGGSRLRQMHLLEAVDQAQARAREAWAELECARRGPVAAIIGGHFPTVAGRCPALRQALDRLAILADSAVPVLLEGAAGSGRRHLARAYAQHLGHRMDTCIVLDVKLVPPSQTRETLVKIVSEMPRGVLVVAQAESLTPEAASWLICHGQTGDIPGRLVVTLDGGTRGPIPDALRRAFATGRVKVPSLGDRLEDFDAIVNSIVRRLGGRPDQLTPAARVLLSRRSWPGEVAELREVLARAVARARGESIQPELLSDQEVHLSQTSMSESLDLGYQGAVRAFRRDLLRHALEVTGANRTHAAELLGVQRTYFMRLIREHGADDIRPVGQGAHSDVEKPGGRC